jgi:hypothetical protein
MMATKPQAITGTKAMQAMRQVNSITMLKRPPN